MTWEWVTLILGIISLIVILFGWVAWTNMNVKINDSFPKTLPDMLTRSESRTEIKDPNRNG